MANGFLTSTPGARHGDDLNSWSPGPSYCEGVGKFTCGGTGLQEISEIGVWCSADAAQTTTWRFAIFTHDAINDCPEAMVPYSLTPEVSHNTETVTKKYNTYTVKPLLDGGSVYWLMMVTEDQYINVDRFTTGGANVYGATTYPKFFLADEWHAKTSTANDFGIYAVYSKVSEVVRYVDADSGSHFSDDFASDPSANWTDLFNAMVYSSGQYLTSASGGSFASHDTSTGSIVQYVKAQLVTGTTDYRGLVFRSTGTGSDGFYEIYANRAAGTIRIARCDNTGYIEDIEDTAPSLAFAVNDVMAVTIEGVGLNTIFRVWKNPTNNIPVSVTGWDSPTDAPDVALSITSTGAYYDTGTYVGIGGTDTNTAFDNFYGGSIEDGYSNALTGASAAHRSLAVWEVAEATDITSDNVGHTVVLCSNHASHTADPTPCEIGLSAWTTGTDNRITVENEVSPNGVWNDNLYRNRGVGNYPVGRITIDDQWTIMSEVQIHCTDNGDDAIHFEGSSGTFTVWIDRCIIRGEGPGSSSSNAIGGIAAHAGSNLTVYVTNCVAYGWVSSDTNKGGIYCSSGTMYAYNNTVYDCSIGLQDAGGTYYAKNNLISNCIAATQGMTAANCGYNSTDLSSLGYTAQPGDRVSQSFSMVDEDNNDFRLLDDDTGAMGFGQEDPGSGLFLNDAIGTTRSTPYTDDFNRANGVLTTPWTLAGGFSAGDEGTILSNQITTDGSTSGAYRTSGADEKQWSEYDVLGSYCYGGPAVRQRIDTQRDYYTVYNVGLYRVVNGTNNLLQTITSPEGTKCRLEVSGTGATVNLRLYYDGVLQYDVDDTDAGRLTSGEIGHYMNTSTAGILDNFRGGDTPWDIGAFQAIAAGGTPIENTLANRKKLSMMGMMMPWNAAIPIPD